MTHEAYLFFHGDILLRDGRLPSSDGPLPPLEVKGNFAPLEGGSDIWGIVKGDELPDGFEAVSRRTVGPAFGMEKFARMGSAWGFASLRVTSRFCGRCGAGMHPASDEHHAMRCPRCGFLRFPVICPAMITAVVRDGRLLMAHNARFPEGKYSVLAGFIEAGESLEQAVAREVREEVGISVKNIRYSSSQFWPFPGSLMLACTAEWESGELAPDGKEITHAAWFAPEDIPPRPKGDVSAAARLIREFKESF